MNIKKIFIFILVTIILGCISNLNDQSTQGLSESTQLSSSTIAIPSTTSFNQDILSTTVPISKTLCEEACDQVGFSSGECKINRAECRRKGGFSLRTKFSLCHNIGDKCCCTLSDSSLITTIINDSIEQDFLTSNTIDISIITINESMNISHTIQNITNLVDISKLLYSTTEFFFQSLPIDKEERLNSTLRIANNICTSGTPITDLSDLERIDNDILRQIIYTKEILNDNYDLGLDTRFDERLKNNIHLLTKNAPIIASYNELISSSCNAKRSNPDSIQDFYYSVLILTFDIVLVKEQIAYKSAFRLTGLVNRKTKLQYIRKLCGNRCHAYAMSGVHWSIRDNFNGLMDEVKDQLTYNDIDYLANYLYDSISTKNIVDENNSVEYKNNSTVLLVPTHENSNSS